MGMEHGEFLLPGRIFDSLGGDQTASVMTGKPLGLVVVDDAADGQ
jgi:hypothetical protein